MVGDIVKFCEAGIVPGYPGIGLQLANVGKTGLEMRIGYYYH